jgi:hypothetical protein
MKFILTLTLLMCIGLLQGCVTTPRHPGILLDDWYEPLDNPVPKPLHTWNRIAHMCKYSTGETLDVGREPCP